MAVNRRQRNIVWYILIALAVVGLLAAVFFGLRPPQPKPLPQVPNPEDQPVQPDPSANLPPVDFSKYKTEPTITLYVAETGEKVSLPLEQYIQGVIAKEMEPDWPAEALAAQAIASRTLTLAAKEAGTIHRLHGTDASTAKEELQAYAPNKINDRVRQAVEMSRGKVLVYGGAFANAIYSSCCGGITASKEESFPEEIQGSVPYFTPVSDPCLDYAPDNQRAWTLSIPEETLRAVVGYNGPATDIRILQNGPSGRVINIGAGNKSISGVQLRKSIGYDVLRSTLITDMVFEGGKVKFSGKGWGNGVGMCQWGAYAWAQKGWNHEDILRYYYQGTQVQKLY